MPDNLIQKKGESTWYVRMAVPADVRKAFGGRTSLTQSLKTGLRSEAMTRRLPYLATWKQQIADARAGRALPENWADDISHALSTIDALKTVRKRQLIGEEAPLISPVPEADKAALAAMEQTGMLEAISELRDYYGDTLEGQLQFQETLAAAFKEMIPEEYARNFSLSKDQALDIADLVNSPASYKSRSPITQKRLGAFRAFTESQGKDLKTVDVLVRKVELLSQWLNKTGNPLNFDTISSYLSELTDRSGNPLTSKTKKQHLWAGNAFWKWAVKYDSSWRDTYKSQPSPFNGHDLPVIKGESIEWSIFSKNEVELLHSKALEKGDINLANLIAIGAYTGCRLEEIGSIHNNSLTLINGIPSSFKITDAKTKAGIREVPIHTNLTHLISHLKDNSPDGYIIAGRKLDESNRYDHRLDAVGKRFGRLKKENHYGREYVFHSIRKTAITLAHQTGGDIAVMPALFGHETGLITLDIYSDGPSMEQKRKVIELLTYNFNLKKQSK